MAILALLKRCGRALEAVAIAGLLALIACGPATAARGPRFAVVVANGAYQNFDRLDATYKDGDTVAAALSCVGFVDPAGGPVKAQRDLSREAITNSLDGLRDKLVTAGPNAFAMVYYSGHGAALGGADKLKPKTTV